MLDETAHCDDDPPPGAILIMVNHVATGHGVTEADVIRRIGVMVAVAGAVLATPDGIALT
jgi:hypothetical protein